VSERKSAGASGVFPLGFYIGVFLFFTGLDLLFKVLSQENGKKDLKNCPNGGILHQEAGREIAKVTQTGIAGCSRDTIK